MKDYVNLIVFIISDFITIICFDNLFFTQQNCKLSVSLVALTVVGRGEFINSFCIYIE